MLGINKKACCLKLQARKPKWERRHFRLRGSKCPSSVIPPITKFRIKAYSRAQPIKHRGVTRKPIQRQPRSVLSTAAVVCLQGEYDELRSMGSP